MTNTQAHAMVDPTAVAPYLHKRHHSGIHTYVRRPRPRDAGMPPAPNDGAAPWAMRDICAAYGWPTGLAGGGVIAIIEMGGGYKPSDVEQFCANNNIPPPAITNISIGSAANNPGQDADADGEVALDIEVAAAAYSIATGLPATIRLYWTADMAAAITQATADGCDVCSISWGADEALWSAGSADGIEQAAAAAVEAGMIVFAAAGDNDASDGGKTPANVDLPSSAPHVVGCGGTRKTATAETVWNHNPGNPDGHGTGGGYSGHFLPMPGWQLGAPAGPANTGRMVPDIAANADPDTGYNVVVGGVTEAIGGTSAVAPLYSGLFAALGRKLGFITPKLYQNPDCFIDITVGDNGLFHAAPGPDACSGMGAPKANALAVLFGAAPAAIS